MNDSAWGRLIGVLVAPEKTFKSIALRPTWLAPLLVLAVLLGVTGFLVAGRVDYGDMFRKQMAEQNRQVSEEQMVQMEEMTEKFAPSAALAMGLLGWPVGFLIIAAIFLVVFRLFGSEIDYKASLSTLLYGLMPLAVSCLLTLPLILRRDSFTVEETQGGLLLSNLGPLAPEDAGPAVTALLASVDLFSIWILVLLIIGYRVVAKVSTAAAAAVMVTLWLLLVAARVGMAAAFS